MNHDLNLGMIGNCAWCALIDRCATVVWACMPRFDSDPVFCGLLKDAGDGDGSFAIDVDRLAGAEQYYERNTAVLVTRLRDEHGGIVEVADFAPRFKQYGRTFRPATLIRRIRTLAGSPRIRVRVRPRFDYDAHAPTITRGSNHIRYVGSDQVLRLTTDASVTAVMDETWFVLEEGITLILGPDEPVSDAPERVGREFLESTRHYWHEWVRYLSLPFEWQDAVIRAAITLKLSAFEDTGAVIAAPTTSIPESPDSSRNWDYRFCWLRDAYFVVNALARLGATRTMEDFIRFLVNLTAGREGEPLRPVYRINGRNDLDEQIIERLPGYRGMGPVRVGNQAFEQVQNDIYGAAVRAAMPLFFDHRIPHGGDVGLFEQLEWLGERAVALYNRPDAGLWEFRGRERVHTFSAAMCWSACHGLARIAARIGRSERAACWRDHAATIRRAIDKEAWNADAGCFVESFGGTQLDASLLLLYEMGYLAADDPRLAGTVDAVESHLLRDGLVFRYAEADDFGEPGTAFTICTFWYIDALAALGRRDEARALFENLLARRNHVGLLSEDLDPKTGELWGNFPQTYSMVGLIRSAMNLSCDWQEAF